MSSKRQLLLLPLKSVKENMANSDTIDAESIPVLISLPPNPYFHQQHLHRSNSLSQNSDNESMERISRMQRLQQIQSSSSRAAPQIMPTTPNSENQHTHRYFRARPRMRTVSDLHGTRLHARNKFEQLRPVASSAVRPNYALALSSSTLNNDIVNGVPVQSEPKLPLYSSPTTNVNPLYNNDLVSFLSSGTTMENLAKLARNLLTLSIQNRPGEILSSLASAVSGSESFVASSVAPIEANRTSGILNIQKVFAELAKKELPLPIKDVTNTLQENETEIFLKTLPDEQRSLLRAAIATGEVDEHTLKSAIGDGKVGVKQKEGKLLEWIQQNRKKVADDMFDFANKLPYYGKYCGSFAGETAKNNRFNAAGALWAVDNQRFIVSKFQFNPGTLSTENVTFWVGPSVRTNNSIVNMTPNANGFYLKPQPINLTVFYKPNIKTIQARIRTKIDRQKRRSNYHAEFNKPERVQSFLENVADNSSNYGFSSVQLFEKEGTLLISKVTNNISFSTNLDSTTKSEEKSKITSPIVNNNTEMEALGWYAGFQPLLLTLPDNKWVKTITWFALRDHKREDIVAYVLIPNGPAFKIPAVVQLRGLTSNSLYNVRSKNIKVLDTKTIEVNEFYFRSNGLEA
ncbi:unnamed protein product [Thelazia callipaeda]|uniref:DM13 domain-containing protein n=1 Tax=Thelazia callipaeda TaxID=103827 RepID=A0A0N5CL61_THECL|nr:unnamed protein product [Thelazia callipaeda]